MRVLVTGGSGFIGSHTIVDLCAHGHEVFVVDNFQNSSPNVLERVSELAQTKVPFEQLDIRDTDKLNGVMGSFKPESVMHFAGLKAVRDGEKNPLEYYSVNVSGTCSVLEAMNQNDCNRIIFSSSATVYGDPHYLPIDEQHTCAPINVYGQTKRTAELILDAWQKARGNASVVALRYFNPVGAHSSSQIGESPRGAPNNLMPLVGRAAADQCFEVEIFGNDYETPDGTGMRDYIHIEDLAHAHTKALEYAQSQGGFWTFNVGTGKAYSVLDIIREFSRTSGRDVPYRIVERRPGDIACSFANPEQARKLLNWKARFNLKEMCQTQWNWQQEKRRELN